MKMFNFENTTISSSNVEWQIKNIQSSNV